MTDAIREVDRDALVQAAAAGVLIVGPLAGLSVLLIDTEADDSGGLSGVLFLAIIIGFVCVGWLAARAAPRVPLTHGALAALATFVIVQTTILLIALVAGHDTDPSPIGLLFGAMLAASAGTIGALVAARRTRRSSR